MKISIKEKCLSVNEAWQGRRFKTEKYKAFETSLLYTLPKKKTLTSPLSVSIVFYFKNRRRDIDNAIKPILDILQKKGYFKNDSQITHLTVLKVVGKGEGAEIEIVELPTP